VSSAAVLTAICGAGLIDGEPMAAHEPPSKLIGLDSPETQASHPGCGP
jgi:hypothetical protein